MGVTAAALRLPTGPPWGPTGTLGGGPRLCPTLDPEFPSEVLPPRPELHFQTRSPHYAQILALNPIPLRESSPKPETDPHVNP